jgi:UDP-N-acetylmuramyl-tripeptide synthetase
MAVTPLRSPEAAARWLQQWVRGSLRTDSRRVQPGDGFIAWPGYGTDGRRFVAAALKAGATTCVVEQDGLEAFGFDDARIASLPQMKASTGAIADAYFEQPSAALNTVAITGTNGKTSSAWWVAQALTLLGQRCGVVGTLGVGVPPVKGEAANIQFTGLTTPDPVLLHETLRGFVAQGFKACAMEASSIGIDEQRLAGVRIAVAVFTNLTQDHLDYHGTMAAYGAAKRKLFAWPGLRAAVVNVDDATGLELCASLLSQAALDLWSCSLHVQANARLTASAVRYEAGGLVFDVVEQGAGSLSGSHATFRTQLIGDYNVSNLLGVVGALRAMGLPLADIAQAAGQLTPVPGRMQCLGGTNEPQAVVDYAHTPDALEKALAALRPLAQARGGQLVCVFGCGGDRDPGKRPLMAAAAQRLANAVVLTSDNPRSEDPAAILRDMQHGLTEHTSVTVQVDRRQAIVDAVLRAAASDVILVAGKGHEDYQEVQGVKHPFSDVAVVQAALTQRAQTSRQERHA